MNMKLVRECGDLKGKTVLLRTDINLEKAEDAFKLEKMLPTVQFLLAQKSKVVLMSHRGRPAGKILPELSLDFALPFLKEKTGVTPTLIPYSLQNNSIVSWDFDKVKKHIDVSAAPSITVLENIRFASGEETNDAIFAQGLASLGDIYVNDAFASDHHASVSVSGLAKLLPSYAGFSVEEEVRHLSHVMAKPEKPLVVIIGGGSKAGEKFAVIKNLYSQASLFLIGGVMANTFLKARGVDIGTSQIDESIAGEVAAYISDPRIILPSDFVFDDAKNILDLGSASAQKYAEIIASAKTIIWNGTMGMFEDARYRAGSLAIAKAIIASGAFSVVGGGETTQFILEEKLSKDFSFLSTGGGAMLAFLAGKPMPGIEALNNN
jgi:phosphoglycerate kinase